LAAGDDDPHDRRPADTERGGDPRHRAVSGADLLERPRPGTVGQTRAGFDRRMLLGPGLLGAPRMWATPDSFVPAHHHRSAADRQVAYPYRTAILRPCHRAAVGHGTTRAMVSTSSSSSPPASAAASTRNPSNPNNAATTEPVTSASTWGSSTIRVILVVITDRASPRPTISSFQSPRRVARSPHSQV